MNPEALLPIIGCVSMFATIFAWFYLKNRENMALIERGINPRQHKTTPAPFVSLKYGLLLIGSGLGLAIAYLTENITSQKIQLQDGSFINEDNPAMYFALIGIGGGIGLVISYFAERKAWSQMKKED